MPNASPLSIFNTSVVHWLLSPPSPPMNLKRWTLQSERQFNSHHPGPNWPMRNNCFLLELVICCYLPSRRALVTCSPFQAQSNFTMYFLQLFIDQVLCRANLLLLLGMLLGVQRRSAAALNHMSYLQCTVKSIDLHKLKTNLYEYVREYSSSHVTWKCHNPKWAWHSWIQAKLKCHGLHNSWPCQ